MKKNIFYMAALAVIAAACSNEDSLVTNPANNGAGDVKMITETISATNGDDATRAAVDADAKFTWTAGDQIAVHVSDGKYYTTEALAAGGSKCAEFTVNYPDGESRDAFAVYPASIVSATAANYGQSGSPLDVTLPSSYTLAEVSGTTTPCPMIATNATGSGWTFKQLCGLLRLTVSGIPDDATYLQVDFGGKQVCGDFSIASPDPGSSTISTSAIIGTSPANAGDKIRITDLGGSTSVTVNIPLPTDQYNGITVSAWNSSNAKVQDLAFSYTAKRAKGKKVTTSLTGDTKSIISGSAITSSSDKAELESVIRFDFKNGSTNAAIDNIRFVRILSGANKLQAEYKAGTNATTYGSVTASKSNEETDNLPCSIYWGLRFDATANDLIAFQVIDAEGKVYSGSITAPTRGYENGYFYNETVNVNLYTFTLASGKKVYFSPGDLGIDGDVYSFTEPFASWNDNTTNLSTSKRTWFNHTEVSYTDIENGHSIYGIKWRNTTGTKVSSTVAFEMDYLVSRTIDNGKVEPYYHVQIGSNYCLLLPPDETVEDDLNGLSEGATITNYVYYLAKGFVLLWNKGRMNVTNQSSSTKWGNTTEGWYWIIYNNTTSRILFRWTTTSKPAVDGGWGNQFRMRVRYVRDVN